MKPTLISVSTTHFSENWLPHMGNEKKVYDAPTFWLIVNTLNRITLHVIPFNMFLYENKSPHYSHTCTYSLRLQQIHRFKGASIHLRQRITRLDSHCAGGLLLPKRQHRKGSQSDSTPHRGNTLAHWKKTSLPWGLQRMCVRSEKRAQWQHIPGVTRHNHWHWQIWCDLCRRSCMVAHCPNASGVFS